MERFKNEGIEYFDDEEVLELLLEMGKTPGDRRKIAGILLEEFGCLKNVLEAREEQLKRIKGLGERGIFMIRSVVPFVKTWERLAMRRGDRIRTSDEAKHFCKSIISGLRNEQFYVICMNSRGFVLGKKRVSEGTLSEVNAYPRVVVETALNYNAHSVLLCHNHPGGTDFASQEDISSTVILKGLLKGVGIILLDHIIVAGADTYSMVEHGDISYN